MGERTSFRKSPLSSSLRDSHVRCESFTDLINRWNESWKFCSVFRSKPNESKKFISHLKLAASATILAPLAIANTLANPDKIANAFPSYSTAFHARSRARMHRQLVTTLSPLATAAELFSSTPRDQSRAWLMTTFNADFIFSPCSRPTSGSFFTDSPV